MPFLVTSFFVVFCIFVTDFSGAFSRPGTGIYVLPRFQALASFAQKSRDWSSEITVGRTPLIFNYY